jgi:hypothetical protein
MLAIIKEWLAKDKGQALATALILILTAVASFGLGRLSKLGESRSPVRWEPAGITTQIVESQEAGLGSGGAASAALAAPASPGREQGQVVASKNSNKYHLPWCSGAQRIKEENKVWFKTIADAKAAGLSPAANCPGLE